MDELGITDLRHEDYATLVTTDLLSAPSERVEILTQPEGIRPRRRLARLTQSRPTSCTGYIRRRLPMPAPPVLIQGFRAVSRGACLPQRVQLALDVDRREDVECDGHQWRAPLGTAS